MLHSIHSSIHPFIHSSIHPSIHQSIHPSINQSVNQSSQRTHTPSASSLYSSSSSFSSFLPPSFLPPATRQGTRGRTYSNVSNRTSQDKLATGTTSVLASHSDHCDGRLCNFLTPIYDLLSLDCRTFTINFSGIRFVCQRTFCVACGHAMFRAAKWRNRNNREAEESDLSYIRICSLPR